MESSSPLSSFMRTQETGSASAAPLAMDAERHGTGSDTRFGQFARASPELHPRWVEFIRFCADLRHGEITRLKIQDGMPVLAEVTTQKIRFGK